jgi:hypothetical protein
VCTTYIVHNDRIHRLTNAAVAKRLERSKIMLVWHVGSDIIFSDEKILQLLFNVLNDRLWLCHDFKTRPQSCSGVRFPKSASTAGFQNAKHYKNEVLEKHLLLAALNLYGDDYFCKTEPHPTQNRLKVV